MTSRSGPAWKAASFVRHVEFDVSGTKLAGAFLPGQSIGVIPPGNDAKGRPPQDMTIQLLSPVTIYVEYVDAPIENIGIVEIYGQTNCKAFSVTDNKEIECTAKSLPAMPPSGTAEGRQ